MGQMPSCQVGVSARGLNTASLLTQLGHPRRRPEGSTSTGDAERLAAAVGAEPAPEGQPGVRVSGGGTAERSCEIPGRLIPAEEGTRPARVSLPTPAERAQGRRGPAAQGTPWAVGRAPRGA